MPGEAKAPHERETLREPRAGDPDSLDKPATQTQPLPRAQASGPNLEPGTPLGRYVVIDKLGAGGMGEVYAAYDRTLDRKVALKLMLDDDRARQPLLLREAHAMAKLSHPNVVAVFDAGMVDNRLFLAMEFVEGRTLRQWQRDEHPSRREVLRVYTRAGRGLAAAHAAGLVHRDFKPANVLISARGEVKVTDFGVARAIGASLSYPSADDSGSLPFGSPNDSAMTRDGVIVGTPGYMAPEQHLGLVVDARSDQFSFCVALFEALCEKRPFPEGSERARLEAITRGALPDAKGGRLPANIRRVLSRGLSYDRDARFPSMDLLLDDLERDPARRTRVWLGLAGAVFAIAAVSGAAAWVHQESNAHRALLCTGGQAEADETWNDRTRAGVEKALLSTGVPYAEDTWRRTRERIDGYMAHWAAMHRQACEATRLRGEQSEQVMSLRMACLEQRREQVRVLAHVLESADRDVASKAVSASMELTSLDACANVTSLMAGEPEPTDPARRAELSAIRTGLAGAKTNLDAGRAAVARAEIEPLVERARALGFQPAMAEALLLSSTAKAESASWDAAAEDARHSVYAAEAGRDDPRKAMAEIALVHWLTETGRLDEAAGWADLADATLRRAGDDGEGRTEWLDASGWLLYRQGKNAEAAVRLRTGLEAARRAESTPLHVAKLARALADDEAALGNYDEAQRLVDEADKALVDAVGPEHPSRILVLINRSVIAARANKRQDELDYARRAIALAQRVAPDHRGLGIAYLDACDALLRLKRYDAALEDCTQAIVASRRVYGASATYVAYADTTTGDVLVGLHRDDAAAGYYDEAVTIHEKTGTRGDSDYADALRGLGTARLHQGRAAEARALLERALLAVEKSSHPSAEDAAVAAAIDYALAQALWASGTRTTRVHDLARDATDVYRRAGYEDEARDVERWLVAHARVDARE